MFQGLGIIIIVVVVVVIIIIIIIQAVIPNGTHTNKSSSTVKELWYLFLWERYLHRRNVVLHL
jgi:preprotein translocase subunit SecG